MSLTILIALEVNDFDTWFNVFDASSDARTAAGIVATAYKNIDNPNTAHLIGTAPSRESFIEFFSSPEMQERQKRAVVKAPPVVTFLAQA